MATTFKRRGWHGPLNLLIVNVASTAIGPMDEAALPPRKNAKPWKPDRLRHRAEPRAKGWIAPLHVNGAVLARVILWRYGPRPKTCAVP